MMTDGPHGLRKQDGKSDHLGLNKSISAVSLVVTSNTIVGDLLKDDRTAPIVNDMATKFTSGLANNSDPSMDGMMMAMKEGLPLRGLITFGMINPNELDMSINTLNSQLSK